MSKTSIFIYVLNLARRETLERMSPEEEAIIDEHFEYLMRGLTADKLILAGRCLDGEFGIVVFCADDEKHAKEFMENDPAVKSRIMTAELHPFRIALIQKD